jgi:hypothetical protein
VTVSEPRWTPRDLDVALASRAADRTPRGRHGHLITEATDPNKRLMWEVPLPRRDYAAKALKDAQEARHKIYPDEDESTLLWRVNFKDEDD